MPFFRVATEGATTDGRAISREWITQMAANYDPKTYGARVWMEHMRGLFADGPFPALGDVKALKAEEVDGKMALFADIDPTDQLKEINGQRQKVYSSIEVNPSFADTGEAYLEGLAVTDSPASLGTDMLQFSKSAGTASPLAARKKSPGNLFSEAVEIDLEFTAEPEPALDNGPTLADRVKSLFKKHDAKTDAGFAAFRTELEQTLEVFVQKHSDLAGALDKRVSTESFSELKTAHEELKAKFDQLYTRLDNEPDSPNRSTATGGNGGAELTDC